MDTRPWQLTRQVETLCMLHFSFWWLWQFPVAPTSRRLNSPSVPWFCCHEGRCLAACQCHYPSGASKPKHHQRCSRALSALQRKASVYVLRRHNLLARKGHLMRQPPFITLRRPVRITNTMRAATLEGPRHPQDWPRSLGDGRKRQPHVRCGGRTRCQPRASKGTWNTWVRAHRHDEWPPLILLRSPKDVL